MRIWKCHHNVNARDHLLRHTLLQTEGDSCRTKLQIKIGLFSFSARTKLLWGGADDVGSAKVVDGVSVGAAVTRHLPAGHPECAAEPPAPVVHLLLCTQLLRHWCACVVSVLAAAQGGRCVCVCVCAGRGGEGGGGKGGGEHGSTRKKLRRQMAVGASPPLPS